MTIRVRPSTFCLALAFTIASLGAPAPAASSVYPTNDCVSRKQKEAARYCKKALGAWSTWEIRQNATHRDLVRQSAANRLDRRWSGAEVTSLARGANCADTTSSSSAARDAIDAGIAGVVGAVNGGLDLGNAADKRCGAALLKGAAFKCVQLLQAESVLVGNLQGDQLRTAHDGAVTLASAAFNLAWARATGRGCPTTATEADLEARVDAIRTDVVIDTTVSPNVDDTQFTTYPATGTTHYLGRDLTPMCMNSTPYAFFAKRGSVNKLVMYYEGGGACWDSATCGFPSCDTNVQTDPLASGTDNPNAFHSGFADISNPSNPFKDWNIVFVSYCSCDVHFGDSAKDYPPHVEHRGYQNSRVVEKWAREHFVNPDEVFVTGSSAGAYGAWFNAPLHEAVWPASEFQVLADAGNGVITQSFLDNYFPNWNFAANVPTDIPGLTDTLTNGTGIVGYTKIVTEFFPRTRWAHYCTAFDGGMGGQTGFYNIMLHNNDPTASFTWWNGSCQFNQVMQSQDFDVAGAEPSNYRYYIGTGSRHTMWGSNKVYSDTTGGVPTLVDWVNGMLGGTPAWSNVECTNCGLLLPGDPAPNPLQAPFEQSGSDVIVNCP